jgi:protein arginine kinase activator
MQQCESCQKKPATVHLTDVANNVKREVHLCEECAKGQGGTIKSYMYKEPSNEFLSQLVESQTESSAGEKDLLCPRCGLTYKKFRSTGKFGCPHDYMVFKKGLTNLLEKIHGKVQHVGKMPLRASDQMERQKELRALRAELEKAVRGEAYEKAAQLRDRIYRLEGRG